MWNFKLPTEIIFGDGAAKTLEDKANAYGRRKMVVTDDTLVKLPQIQKIIEGLSDVVVFSDVNPNPTVKNVDGLTKALRRKNTDVVIAIGGGSSIDCTKAAACMVKTNELSVQSFHTGGKKFGNERLPLIAVPTTAGTGSEVTPFAVLDDTEKKVKGPIATDSFYPTLAIVDPELTHSVPAKITAITALDALSHSIEGYWSKNHQPLCDAFALEAAKRIFKHLGDVIDAPSDQTGRRELSYAALLAGMAFQLPKNAIMHACSFPLSSMFHMPHGTACAFTMEEAIKLNTPHMEGRMELFANYCGFHDIEDMCSAIGKFKRQGGLPTTVQEAGIPDEKIEGLITASFHPLMNNNPKEVTSEDLRAIYKRLGA